MADVRAAVELWRILRRERPDVLHTHNPKPGLYGRIVGRLARVPVVVNTCHGLYAKSDPRLPRTIRRLVLEADRRPLLRRRAGAERGGLDLLSASRLPPPADPAARQRRRPRALRPGALRRRRAGQELRRELGAATTRSSSAWSAVWSPRRGCPSCSTPSGQLEPTATAGRDRRTRRPGEGRLARPALLRRAAARVRFLGIATTSTGCYGAMDMFCCRPREGFPRAAMEAAASACLIVATDIRGCRQVVDDGVTGLLVPVGDAGALAEAVRALGDDPDGRRGMGDAAAARARAEFDERRVVEIVVDTYRRVRGPGSASPVWSLPLMSPRPRPISGP